MGVARGREEEYGVRVPVLGCGRKERMGWCPERVVWLDWGFAGG